MLIPLLFSVLAPGCTKATGDAPAVLRRVAAAVGLEAVGTRVLHVEGSDVVAQDYQSDRMYPPYLSSVSPLHYWYSPATRVERTTIGFVAGGYNFPGSPTLGSERAAFTLRDTVLTPSEGVNEQMYATRPLDAWTVIGDWIADGGATVSERCVYRDYPRLVLTRAGTRGDERLFVDEKSWFPVKLERVEPHYLWGQNRVEYVYATWLRVGSAAVPGVSYRIVDGATHTERNVAALALVPADSAPKLTVPATPARIGYALPDFLSPTNPDTTRVGPHAFVLRNRGYREMVMLARDTVFLFDATQGDERARRDSAWIAALFPGRHPMALVVTDLAWPHIAGMRFWVARGASVYAHRAARPFLDSVASRHWTLAPDALERSRPRARLRLTTVSDTLRLAGGAITLFAIDGVASEVALAAFDRGDGVLWASDFIQSATEPTMYLDEMCRATKRVGIAPVRVAAEHLAVTAWSVLEPLARCSSAPQ